MNSQYVMLTVWRNTLKKVAEFKCCAEQCLRRAVLDLCVAENQM